jgi:predicted MFS family arabinose efflux permease
VLTRATTLTLAIAAGVAVANIYYIQPLLEMIATDLHGSVQQAGQISLGIQLGYALGILFIVPLGDIRERRSLSVVMFLCAAVGLVGMALAPNVAVLAVAGFITGAATIVSQIVMPFAADLADAGSRGRIVASIQMGVILGTVYSRAAGGLIGAHFGWRVVFWYAAFTSLVAAAALARTMPFRAPHAVMSYPMLLRSVLALARTSAILRATMAIGLCVQFSFSAFWTTVAFHFHTLGYGSDIVGYLGVVALIGTFFTLPLGALADRRGTVVTGAIALALLALAFTTFWVRGDAIVVMFVAMLGFAMGMQFNQISNQSRIFEIDHAARSRLNTGYMFVTFSGGAAGAMAGAAAWQAGGWPGVCALCLGAVGCAAVILMLLGIRAGAVPSPQTSDVR